MAKSNYPNFVRMDFPKGLELPSEYFQSLELDVNGEHLTGIKIAKDLSKPADFVFLHGARGGNYSRVMTFAKFVVENGHSIVAFDHSGHGRSSGREVKSSLKKKTTEATEIIDTFANGNPLTVCSSSMGGYIAIKMLEKYKVRNLILYCPAVYDRRAFAAPFDAGFTEIIRQEQSWKNTDAGEILQNFAGNLLVIIGSYDTVIPQGVIELVDKSTTQTRRKEILTLAGVPHAIHDWMQNHPDLAQKVAEKVAQFSSED